MIVLFSGKPGTGKTYRCVRDLYKIQDHFFIIHNIAGLKNELFEVPECIRTIESIVESLGVSSSAFFTVDCQTEITETIKKKYGRNVLMVIDEAQNILGRKDDLIKEWLSYHRHLGQEIWLVAQRNLMIHTDYRALVEYELRAKNDSIFSLPFIYMYEKLSEGERVGFSIIFRSKKIYNSYKSFNMTQGRKKLSWLMPAIVIVICLCIAWFINAPKRLMANSNMMEATEKQVKKYNREGSPRSTRPSATERKETRSPRANSPSAIESQIYYVGHFNDEVLLEKNGVIYYSEQLLPSAIVLEANSCKCVLMDIKEHRVMKYYAKIDNMSASSLRVRERGGAENVLFFKQR